MKKSFIIDCLPKSAARYRGGYAVVVLDVIRATTTLVTALDQGRRVYPARDSDEACVIAGTLPNPLLVGELGGNMPYGFDLTNSPAQLSARKDVERPIVLVSSSGTQLLLNAQRAEAVYAASFRNASAVARYVARFHEKVAILGAGTRGQFRLEDQMGCTRVAKELSQSGFEAEDDKTREVFLRWRGAPIEEARRSESAEYLIKSGQSEDLEFILSHVEDLEIVPVLEKGEMVRAGGE